MNQTCFLFMAPLNNPLQLLLSLVSASLPLSRCNAPCFKNDKVPTSSSILHSSIRKLVNFTRHCLIFQIFEGYIPESQDFESEQERLTYLEDIVKGAGLIANTCQLLYAPLTYENWEECIGKFFAFSIVLKKGGGRRRQLKRAVFFQHFASRNFSFKMFDSILTSR